MLEELYQYEYVGKVSGQKETDTLEKLFYNHNVPYKLKEQEDGVGIYVAMKYAETCRDVVEALNADNLYFHEEFEHLTDYYASAPKKAERPRVINRYTVMVFVIMLVLLFFRALSLLKIL